jgi:hypothetical protein
MSVINHVLLLFTCLINNGEIRNSGIALRLCTSGGNVLKGKVQRISLPASCV